MSPQYENNFILEINRCPQVLMKHFFPYLFMQILFHIKTFFFAGSCWYIFQKKVAFDCVCLRLKPYGVFILILFFHFNGGPQEKCLLTVHCIYHVIISSSFSFSFSPHRLMFNALTKEDKLNRQIFLIRHELSLRKLRKRSKWDMSAIAIQTQVILIEKSIQRWFQLFSQLIQFLKWWNFILNFLSHQFI